MEKIISEYLEIDNKTLEIVLYYDIGGYSYSTSRINERGYYASVTPVEISKHIDSTGLEYEMKKVTPGNGVKLLLIPVKRKSKKAEEKALEELKKERANLIAYVLNK